MLLFKLLSPALLDLEPPPGGDFPTVHPLGNGLEIFAQDDTLGTPLAKELRLGMLVAQGVSALDCTPPGAALELRGVELACRRSLGEGA